MNHLPRLSTWAPEVYQRTFLLKILKWNEEDTSGLDRLFHGVEHVLRTKALLWGRFE